MFCISSSLFVNNLDVLALCNQFWSQTISRGFHFSKARLFRKTRWFLNFNFNMWIIEKILRTFDYNRKRFSMNKNWTIEFFVGLGSSVTNFSMGSLVRQLWNADRCQEIYELCVVSVLNFFSLEEKKKQKSDSDLYDQDCIWLKMICLKAVNFEIKLFE